MKFTPEKYKLKDEQMKPFIDPEEIWSFIHKTTSNPDEVRKIIKKSLAKQRLSLHDVAVLINTKDEHLVNEIKDGARELKKMIYGNRIVLFAPLYVGNKCQNDCKYCGLRMSNKELQRKTMTREELRQNVISLEDVGQKRLIVVFGEHIEYNAEYIAETIREVYKVRHNNGAIRRANVNAAPFDIEGFKIIKSAGIGTYQIFQETYHPETYSHYHPSGRKADYNYRLTALDRAQEAGIDDVGIGVLFGLYDWRFELLSLLRHVNHLEACYNVGPHTISFPRIQMASHSEISEKYLVSDNDFEKLVAILRLAVPYTGMILTARENEAVRDKVIE
ncbi:MAG: [FeFe] hydrogenase H-cluster radical SAM maturase HydG, partial [Bacteroidetes bacterium]|nr:[FeFe] hydrogenase H-cluster radical SAM maturase HydG [Bacteroidota bacterium]